MRSDRATVKTLVYFELMVPGSGSRYIKKQNEIMRICYFAPGVVQNIAISVFVGTNQAIFMQFMSVCVSVPSHVSKHVSKFL